MPGLFDLSGEGIVGVGLAADLVDGANDIGVVAVESDIQGYVDEQLAHCAGAVLALVSSDVA